MYRTRGHPGISGDFTGVCAWNFSCAVQMESGSSPIAIDCFSEHRFGLFLFFFKAELSAGFRRARGGPALLICPPTAPQEKVAPGGAGSRRTAVLGFPSKFHATPEEHPVGTMQYV